MTVDADDHGVRLDRFAALRFADLSRSYARQLIEDGHLRVNGADARPSTTLKTGDLVSLRRPFASLTDLVAEDLPLDVVYEDDDLVVVNKAAGMVVHPAPGHARGTLVNALLWHYPGMTIGDDLRPGIVHRLDRGTSGLLVVARNSLALQQLQAQQQARTMRKLYLAVVDGGFKEESGTIDAPIGRHQGDRQRMAVIAEGRAARSHWRVIERLGDYTLIEVRLETGRTHQIRVHFSYRSRPLLGDPLYGPRRPRATFGLGRQFLHACLLGFAQPTSGEWLEFRAALPADLQQVRDALRRRAAGPPGAPAPLAYIGDAPDAEDLLLDDDA